MTFQEAKDQIAKEEGYKDWTTMENSSNVSWTCLLQCSEDAAKLYGKSKWDEACEAQRISCRDEYMKIDVYDHSNKFETIDREIQAIRNATKPEFKN